MEINFVKIAVQPPAFMHGDLNFALRSALAKGAPSGQILNLSEGIDYQISTTNPPFGGFVEL